MTDVADDWFSDEAFWITTYDFMFPDSRFVAAPDEVEQILALARPTGSAVLDLACGPGRHSVPLAQRGLTVTGVDHSAFLLGRARARAAEKGLVVEWVESDMRDFKRQASFDLALCLFTSFGFFRDDADNQRVLDNVAASLRVGGTFVLDVLGKEVLARIFIPTSSHEIPSGLVFHRREVANDWSRVENEWILLQDDKPRTFRFDHWIYSGREIEQMFRQAGFSEVQLYGGFSGVPYGREASRLVVVGRKGV